MKFGNEALAKLICPELRHDENIGVVAQQPRSESANPHIPAPVLDIQRDNAPLIR
jgi:hypothetical protein